MSRPRTWGHCFAEDKPCLWVALSGPNLLARGLGPERGPFTFRKSCLLVVGVTHPAIQRERPPG